MGETLTREHMVSWLAAVEASPWRTVGAPQADLRTALEMARASLDLAEQLSAARRELAEALDSAGANAEALLLARRELGEVREVLAKVEWSGYQEEGHSECPCCYARARNGHRADCALAAALKGTDHE